MLLENKIGWAGIVFLLLTTGISGPRRTAVGGLHGTPGNGTPANAEAGLRQAPATVHGNNDQQIQQSLSDKGHYRGKVDGVLGLRTRASIRAYQRAEKLPITGQLDTQTASRIAVGTESGASASKTGGPDVGEDIDETRRETSQGKPSAGIEWSKDRRSHKKPRSIDRNLRGANQ